MEHYNYFCTITKHLYHELEVVSAIGYLLNEMDLDNGYYLEKKQVLLHQIEEHLQGLELALFDKDLED